jgi:hypothetical protein
MWRVKKRNLEELNEIDRRFAEHIYDLERKRRVNVLSTLLATGVTFHLIAMAVLL